jgi:hypothetical protein
LTNVTMVGAELLNHTCNPVDERYGDFSTVTDIPGFKRIRIVQKTACTAILSECILRTKGGLLCTEWH